MTSAYLEPVPWRRDPLGMKRDRFVQRYSLFIEKMDEPRRAPTRNQWAFRKQHKTLTNTALGLWNPVGNHSSPTFRIPGGSCLADPLIPADTSDRERPKEKAIGCPTASRLAPAHAVLTRRGNDATLLMLPREGALEGRGDEFGLESTQL